LLLKFQSTLPRRERHFGLCIPNGRYRNFNPRSREGSDMSENGIVFYIAISIHAPAKGAT